MKIVIKNSTKRKIIEWVTKVLQYYPPIEIAYDTKVFEIKNIKISKWFRPEERLFQNKILMQEIPYLLYEEGILEFGECRIPMSSKDRGKDHIGTLKFRVIKRQIK